MVIFFYPVASANFHLLTHVHALDCGSVLLESLIFYRAGLTWDFVFDIPCILSCILSFLSQLFVYAVYGGRDGIKRKYLRSLPE